VNKAVGREIRRSLPASLEAMEAVIAEICAACQEERLDRFATELLLREGLTNAVVHGCGCDAGQCARCVVRVRPGRLTIAVSDDGCGFDWKTVQARRAEDTADSGRGLAIFRAYATRVRFNRTGNAVALWKRF
jgi:serine/threonine-protein kinase RsbW